jgi:hypothetical protein
VTRERLEVWLGGTALAGLAWSLVIRLTGGFVWDTALIRLASRDPVRPLQLGLLCGVACWYLNPPRLETAVRRFFHTHSHVLIPSLAVAGSGLLLAQLIGGRPLWLDEEMIALNLRDRTFRQLAQPLTFGQTSPFGWLALEHAALRVLGPSEIALRAAPALFGVGVIVLSVWVGRRWLGSAGATALVLCCAFGQWVTFYDLELKPYSADTFWAFLIPALAAWAADADSADRPDMARRGAVFWTAAAVGLWLGNGALFVTPASALVMTYGFWRRAGGAGIWRGNLFGVLWMTSFAADYVLTLRPALQSSFLADVWAGALPPPHASAAQTLGWLAAQARPFAIKPGGVYGWAAFWAGAVSGLAFLVREQRLAGLAFSAVPVSGALLAALRVVPLYERLSLWMVPALYVGLAYFVETAARMVAAAGGSARGSHWPRLASAAGLALALSVIADVVVHGIEDVRDSRPRNSHHDLDDRAAVRSLMQAHEPGDAVMTTKLALPALWWYGKIPMAGPGLDGSRQPDGGPILRIGYRHPGPDCTQDSLRMVLEGQRRVLVYLGFRVDDVPQGFDDLLLLRLRRLGRITSDRAFSESGRVVIVDLQAAPRTAAAWSDSAAHPAAASGASGCVVVEPIGDRGQLVLSQ